MSRKTNSAFVADASHRRGPVRVRTRRITASFSYGSAPWSLDDGKLNDWNGGRGVYFKDPNGHVLELMTVPQ